VWWVVKNPALGFSVGSVRELSIVATCSAALPDWSDLKFLLRIRNRIAPANLTGVLCHRPAENGGAIFKYVPAGDKTFLKVQLGANLSERPPHSSVSESADSSCCWIPVPRQLLRMLLIFFWTYHFIFFTLFSSPFYMKCIEFTTRTYNFKNSAVGS
jgi:hypothetical protein